MQSRLVIPLLCAAAIVFACGPRPHGTHPGAAPTTVVTQASGTTAAAPAPLRRRLRKGDTTRVDAAVAVVSEADGVHLALRVVNLDAKQLEIAFPDGRTRDFAILDASGTEVWRWSRGRLFTQSVQNKFLAGGDTAVYEERWRPSAPGLYTVVATLRSRNFPLERRETFELRPAAPAGMASVASAPGPGSEGQ